MNRNILIFCAGAMLCAAWPAAAQTASTATEKATAAKTKAKKIVVKDYKSFKEYVASEEANLKVKPITTDNGPVKEKLEKIGIHFEAGRAASESSDGDKIAYLSPDKKGIAVVFRKEKSINLFDSTGGLIKKVQMQIQPVAPIGFSRSRVFEFKGGFGLRESGIDVYDFSGKLIKTITDCGLIDVFLVSHDQKWLAVSTGDQNDNLDRAFFVLYDMNGREVWRKETLIGDHPQIEFSRDDRYASLKLPVYYKNPQNPKSGGSRWVYIFQVSDGHLISEGHYED